MKNPVRELTEQEKRRIRKLVTQRGANFHEEYGCLPLDCDCVMLGKVFCGNAMCRYFRDFVLPNDPELNAAMQSLSAKGRKQCGKMFPAKGKQIYCCESYAVETRKQQTAERIRLRCNALTSKKTCVASTF